MCSSLWLDVTCETMAYNKLIFFRIKNKLTMNKNLQIEKDKSAKISNLIFCLGVIEKQSRLFYWIFSIFSRKLLKIFFTFKIFMSKIKVWMGINFVLFLDWQLLVLKPNFMTFIKFCIFILERIYKSFDLTNH